MMPVDSVLERAAKCFTSARQSVMDGTPLLHEIREKRLYDGRYASFGEYVEQECQISQSFAAKLCKVYEHYVIQGGVARAQLKEVDSEKLYLAISLPGTPDFQAVRAQTWSRAEIKAELASNGGEECLHTEQVTICAHCHKRIV